LYCKDEASYVGHLLVGTWGCDRLYAISVQAAFVGGMFECRIFRMVTIMLAY
jgi:hypothetical protein